MATYTLAGCPRTARASCSASACSSVIRRSGEPPPMALYPSELFDTRNDEMTCLETLAVSAGHQQCNIQSTATKGHCITDVIDYQQGCTVPIADALIGQPCT